MLDSKSEPAATAPATTALSASVSLGWQPMRASSIGLAEQLVEHFGALVRNHGLRVGVRLPSVRALAESAGVSRDTVVQAYDRLAAQGLIVSRRGSGFYVAAQRSVTAPAEPAKSASPQVVEFDTAYLLRGIFRESGDGTTNAGCLPGSWMDQGLITGAMRAITRQGSRAEQSLLSYGVPQGFVPLRQHIASYLQAQEVPAHPETHLMTVGGVTQGLDLIVRCFLRPGDTVLVEDPAWFLVFGLLRSLGVRVVPVPRLRDGPDIQALEQLAQAHQPKLFITNSVVHNPTGFGLSLPVAYDVLRLAEQHNFLILEDDTYADFHPGQPVRLATLDRLRRVMLVGGFSKTLAGSLRMGYIAAQPQRIAALTDAKLLSGLTTSELGERVVHRILADGLYRKHVLRLRERLDEARQRCLKFVNHLGLQVHQEPNAGMFVWVDAARDTELLARKAAVDGVLLAPGVLFSAHQQPSTMLRLPVAMADSASERSALSQLLR